MTRKNSSGTGVFMMEMMMVVFCFILCASTCILVFVKSNQMSRYAQDTNQGVLAAESIAEVWKAEGGEGLTRRLAAISSGGAVAGAGSCRMYWDKDWKVTAGAEHAAYQAEIAWTEAGGLASGTIQVTDMAGTREIFTMPVSKYQAVP